jgi:hypothetical protein
MKMEAGRSAQSSFNLHGIISKGKVLFTNGLPFLPVSEDVFLASLSASEPDSEATEETATEPEQRNS